MYQGGFILPRPQLLGDRNSSVIRGYEEYAVNVAVLMGADRTVAEAEMKDMVIGKEKFPRSVMLTSELNLTFCYTLQSSQLE